jgi:hypothetical protein
MRKQIPVSYILNWFCSLQNRPKFLHHLFTTHSDFDSLKNRESRAFEIMKIHALFMKDANARPSTSHNFVKNQQMRDPHSPECDSLEYPNAKRSYQLTIPPLNKLPNSTPPQHPNITPPHITSNIRAFHTHNTTISKTSHENGFVLVRFVNHTHATGRVV